MREDDTIGQVIQRDLDRLPTLRPERLVPQRRRRQGIGWARSAAALPLAALLVVAAIVGGLALGERRQQSVGDSQPTPGTTGAPAPLSIHVTANEAVWAGAHVPTDTILMLLGRAGIAARVSPPAPAKALLFNAADLELVAADEQSLRGFVIYRYPDAAAAAAAYHLPVVQDPRQGTISWIAKPRFVLLGDALVNYATDDEAVHERVARALVYPDVATIPPPVCAEQRARILGMSAIILRLDRAAAKRMTVAELISGGGPDVGPSGVDRNTMLCVVAVAGELRQPRGPLATPNYPWGVFVSGAGDESIGATSMAHSGSWPAFFDALPNRVTDPLPGTVVDLVDGSTIKVTLDTGVGPQLGDPVLLRADSYTDLVPRVRDLTAIGLRTGDRVVVYFQPERRDAATGGYVLAKLAASTHAVPVVGAAPVGDSSARAACDGKLGSARLVGAFESTAAAVASWVENASYPDAPQMVASSWRALVPTAAAYVCYFDGLFATSQPPPAPGASQRPLPDRALILLDSNGARHPPAKYGYRDSLPLVGPGGRF
jgi:hypothetical protein